MYVLMSLSVAVYSYAETSNDSLGQPNTLVYKLLALLDLVLLSSFCPEEDPLLLYILKPHPTHVFLVKVIKRSIYKPRENS